MSDGVAFLDGRAFPRLALTGLALLWLAGCSSDVTRFDMSIVKKTRISERVNVELRGEFLNAFNNINFLVGNPNNDTNTATNFSSATFGQVTQAYNDQSTTYDPGGRLIQFVMRINF